MNINVGKFLLFLGSLVGILIYYVLATIGLLTIIGASVNLLSVAIVTPIIYFVAIFLVNLGQAAQLGIFYEDR